MTEYTKASGYGMPAASILADCVVSSIRAGNLAGKIEARLSPQGWENAIVQLGQHRPLDFERFENTAIAIAFVCGRMVRIVPDASIQGPDEVHYRALP